LQQINEEEEEEEEEKIFLSLLFVFISDWLL
jgi:hypothetical protein